MPLLSPRLVSFCGLLDGGKGVAWRGAETDLVALARRHRVEPLLHVRLAAPTSSWRPAKETTHALAQAYGRNAERVLRSLAWLQRLTEALAAEGIEARPLKGLPLAAQAYDRIADRHCGDIDLLVDGRGLRGRADRVARALGLRPQLEMTEAAMRFHRLLYKEDCYVTPDGIGVDLNYREGVGEHVLPDFMAFGSEAWQPCSVDSISTQRLTGTPLLVYLLSHGTRSRWHRLKWVLDIRRLTYRFDTNAWIELLDIAVRENLEAHVKTGLLLLGDAFQVPSLRAIQSGSNVHAIGLRFALRECQVGLNDQTGSLDTVWRLTRWTLYELLVQRSWRARLAVAGNTLIRTADIARWKLPIPLIWILAPIARLFSFLYRRALRPIARGVFH